MKPSDLDQNICVGDYVIDRMDDGQLREVASFGEISRNGATVFMVDGGVMALSEITSDDILLESEAGSYVPANVITTLVAPGPLSDVQYHDKPAHPLAWAPVGSKRRSSDSAIAKAIQDLEPKLVCSQYGKAIAALDDHFREVLEAGGPQAGRYLLEQIWLVMGERRAASNVVQEADHG